MTFKNLVAAAFGALVLSACGGGGSDASDVDHSKLPPPPKDAYCKSMGDKCKLIDNRWVVRDEPKPGKGDNDGKGGKGGADQPPPIEGSFDYSDLGTTDHLTDVVKGMAFYAKGTESPLDKDLFESKVTQSPIIGWSSVKRYDEDLYNFVAVKLSQAKKSEASKDGKDPKDAKGKKDGVKFAFDKIGLQNQEVNGNAEFFAFGEDKAKYKKAEFLGASMLDASGAYARMRLPSVVNTMIWMDGEGHFQRDYADEKNKVFHNQEEDLESPVGSGVANVRVYGVNAFLVEAGTGATAKVVDPATSKVGDSKTETYSLKNRAGTYLKHANYAFFDWKPSKRVANMTADKMPLALYDGKEKRFPTDVDLGALEHVQFGRLTGEGLGRATDKLEGYAELIMNYPFASGAPAISNNSAKGGNVKGEDWYFARGTVAAPRTKFMALKTNSQDEVIYRGQALMFGLNYDVKPGKPKRGTGNQSTNSVLPSSTDDYGPWNTLLDGKQNFVTLRWNPSEGTVKGSVFGVWTKATFMRANKDFNDGSKDHKKGEILPVVWDAAKKKPKFDEGKAGATPAKLDDYFGASGLVAKYAISLAAYRNPLVELDGKVAEAGNTFRGVATRCLSKDCEKGDKGMFIGAFFGADGSEVAGIIDSQTGSFKKRDLKNPETKWGGVFGAKTTPGVEEFDILDKEFNYSTSTEYF